MERLETLNCVRPETVEETGSGSDPVVVFGLPLFNLVVDLGETVSSEHDEKIKDPIQSK
jgi:hypothetical protein